MQASQLQCGPEESPDLYSDTGQRRNMDFLTVKIENKGGYISWVNSTANDGECNRPI